MLADYTKSQDDASEALNSVGVKIIDLDTVRKCEGYNLDPSFGTSYYVYAPASRTCSSTCGRSDSYAFFVMLWARLVHFLFGARVFEKSMAALDDRADVGLGGGR